MQHNTDNQKATVRQKAPTDTERRHAFIAKHGVTGGTLESRQPQHSPNEDEICRQAGLQAARANKWQGWDWKAYQTSITRQNHHISKTEAHAAKLAEALRSLLYAAEHIEHIRTQLNKAAEALAAYESEAAL